MRYSKEEPPINSEQAIDLGLAVEELHKLGFQELHKLLKDSENFTIQHYTEKGLLVQIDMERLAWYLPLHLIAVLLSLDEDEIRYQYLLRGFRLLHSLSELAPRHAKLEQILLEEFRVTEQIVDLVFYMLVLLSRQKKENHVTSFVGLLHSSLVACSLHLLTGYISSQWQDLVHVLIAHPKVDIFMDVAFDAVQLDIKLLQSKILCFERDISCQKPNALSVEKTIRNLCLQCEASLQFLQSLCQQKLFRECLLRNKELCKNGGILSLVQAVLMLDMPLHFDGSSKVVAGISRLKSRVLSILLLLCETETVSYLDEVASSPKSKLLAETVALKVLNLLKTAFGRRGELKEFFETAHPRGLVLLNSMRLVDIFSDDSNFRRFITTNITHVLAEILSLPQEDFLSNWCSTDLPAMEEDAALEYDPFVASGVVLVLSTGLETAVQSTDANTECTFNLNTVHQASYTQQRTSLLVKIIANLHCFVPSVCIEQDRNLFFNKFLECLQLELPTPSSTPALNSDVQKTATICKNLGFLLGHAASLIPNFLNEEDVDLLSRFVEQLRSSAIPSQVKIETDMIPPNPHYPPILLEQNHVNKHVDSLGLDNFSSVDVCHCHKEGEVKAGHTSHLTGNLGAIVQVTTDLRPKSEDLKEETSESSPVQDDLLELGDRKPRPLITRSASETLREIDKDNRNAETSGSDISSTREKGSLDQVLDDGDFSKLTEHAKESGFRGTAENEKSEITNGVEKRRRKRKRNIMNDRQITLIERALLDEPEMHRNAALLQSWADKLSNHGSELTSSQLKNWLNNRKAKLARAAKDVRGPSEGDNNYLDKSAGSGQGNDYDSPESPSDEYYVPSTSARRGNNQATPKLGVTLRSGNHETPAVAATDSGDLTAQEAMQTNCTTSQCVQHEPGQSVSLLDKERRVVANGKVYQVEGSWHGNSLDESGKCVVDVIELKVDRWKRLPYPSEAAGTTFHDAETKNGVMRVAWDAKRMVVHE
ncbi:hypothetical protein Sjap_007626 [Stephania japonica]|uniref:Homeobox domain-containing protein n=1 Tax=Stephania japonica TaxID=461633 RepID=A0AAP0PAL3_9MAGN